MKPESGKASNQRNAKPIQAELPLGAPAVEIPSDSLCPVYYPKTGEELKTLALRLDPILQKAGWEVRIRPAIKGGEDYLELCDPKNERKSRRLSPDEIIAWQVVLDQFAGNFDCLPGVNLGLTEKQATTESNGEKEQGWTTGPRPALKKK